MVEDRDGSGFGFRTMPGTGNEVGEQLYYAIEITPTREAKDPATGPRMTPMFDEVIVTYIVGETAEVIRERELTYDFLNE